GPRGRESREQRPDPGDVAVVFAGLVRVAEDDVFDTRRVDAGALDRRLHHESGEVVGADAGQRAAGPPERGADGVVDERSGHVSSPRLPRPAARASVASAASVASVASASVSPVRSESDATVLSPKASRTAKPSPVTSNTAWSVYTRVTQPTPVSG